jgi:hypothetical protein
VGARMSAAIRIRICPLAVTAMRRRSLRKVSGFPVRSAAGFAPNADSVDTSDLVEYSRDCAQIIHYVITDISTDYTALARRASGPCRIGATAASASPAKVRCGCAIGISWRGLMPAPGLQRSEGGSHMSVA